jgi:hypothetical protein
LLNFVSFQFTWFACVLGAVWGFPLLGVLAALTLGGMSVLSSRDPKRELFFILIAAVLGTALDLIPLSFGAFSFVVETRLPWGYPLWMSAIWVGFAATFGSSLSWLSDRYALSALLGFVGGPLAYLGGQSLGAIALGENYWWSMLLIGCFWAVVTPLLFFLRSFLMVGLGCQKNRT